MGTGVKYAKRRIDFEFEKFFSENYIKYYIDIAFLYGSWAGGYPRKDSDIDLAVVFSKDIEEEQEKFFLITDISYDLEKK